MRPAVDLRGRRRLRRRRWRRAPRDARFDVLARDAPVAPVPAMSARVEICARQSSALDQRRQALLASSPATAGVRRRPALRRRRRGGRSGASPADAERSARRAPRPARLRRPRRAGSPPARPSAGAGTSTATLSVSSSTIGSFALAPRRRPASARRARPPWCLPAPRETMSTVSIIRTPPARRSSPRCRSTDGSAHSISSG